MSYLAKWCNPLLLLRNFRCLLPPLQSMRNFVLTSSRTGEPRCPAGGDIHGRLYTTRLAVGNEKDALAELALLRRNPAAYVACAQQAQAVEETTSGNAPILLDLPTVERLLCYLKGQGRTVRATAPRVVRLDTGQAVTSASWSVPGECSW